MEELDPLALQLENGDLEAAEDSVAGLVAGLEEGTIP